MFNSDTHNFGRAVRPVSKDILLKPRSVYWEWLFLDLESPLRDYLESSIFNIFPYEVRPLSNLKVRPRGEGEGLVEILRLSENKEIKATHFYSIGIVSALATFFGLSDLHYQNVLFGMDSKDAFKFTPIDIESCFDVTLLPYQTLLVPGGNQFDRFSAVVGMKRSLSEEYKEGDIAAICSGYFFAMGMLIKHRDKVAEILESLQDLEKKPIRCYLRSTPEYLGILSRNLDQEKLSTSLLNEELDQLRRNEIPYFWRYLGDDKIYYFIAPEEVGFLQASDISSLFKVKYHFSVKSWSKYIGDNASNLTKAGTLHLARNLMRWFKCERDQYLNAKVEHKDEILKFSDKSVQIMARIKNGIL